MTRASGGGLFWWPRVQIESPPGLGSKSGSRGKIHDRYRHGRIASAASQRRTVGGRHALRQPSSSSLDSQVRRADRDQRDLPGLRRLAGQASRAWSSGLWASSSRKPIAFFSATVSAGAAAVVGIQARVVSGDRATRRRLPLAG
jgi:hypothetical protein